MERLTFNKPSQRSGFDRVIARGRNSSTPERVVRTCVLLAQRAVADLGRQQPLIKETKRGH
jgi:hypothetical protein